ncbi:MAG: hypothetical protein ACR2QA_18510 [Solirubrobacteraceae bacterium]
MTWTSSQSLVLPLEYLGELGVLPAPPAAMVLEGSLEELLAAYRRYLLLERRLVEHTVRDVYIPAARLFLAGREGPESEGLGVERLSAAGVSVFLVAECPKRSVSGARDLASALRAFLRYLHVAELIEAPFGVGRSIGR